MRGREEKKETSGDREREREEEEEEREKEQKKEEGEQSYFSHLHSYTKTQLEKICDYILWGLGKKEVEEGYSEYFSPLWEEFHLVCNRGEGGEGGGEGGREGGKGGRGVEERATCSMKEYSFLESLEYFCDYVLLKSDVLEEIIINIDNNKDKRGERRGSVGGGEVVRELIKWIGERENREELKEFYSSPQEKTSSCSDGLSFSSSFSSSSSSYFSENNSSILSGFSFSCPSL